MALSDFLPVILLGIVVAPQLVVSLFYIRSMGRKSVRSPKAQIEYLKGAQRFYLKLSLILLAVSVVAIFAVPLIFDLS